MSDLSEIIKSYEYAFINEAELQDQIETVLVENKVLFKREYVLDKESRIDFYLPDSKTGVEVKVKGGASIVSGQLSRYANSDQIENLILITTRMAHVILNGTMYGRIKLKTIFIEGL